MRRIVELLKRFTTSKIGIGVAAFMFAYMIRNGAVGCPLCGNQGLHPWEWGGFVGL